MIKQIDANARRYGIGNWGAGYFTVNRKGGVSVDVEAQGRPQVDLSAVMDDLIQMKLDFPVVVRFPQILGNQVRTLNACFQKAIKEYEYEGSYQGVFPVKVNHRRDVVEEIVRAGARSKLGLEVGSKPELFVALGLIAARDRMIICNGFKDQAYLRTILQAQRMGLTVICVAESVAEVGRYLKLAKRMHVRPRLGIRAMLYSKGSGRWEKSSGPESKFGMTTRELLQVVDLCKKAELLGSIEMLHFHVGSQVTQIRKIKNAIKEAARVYSKLRPTAPGLTYLNVGGGLGVDYDGSRSSAESSTNYTAQEYANDVVYTIGELCDGEDIPHPVIVTESGRSIAAYHSVILINVFREIRNGVGPKTPVDDKDPPVIIELSEILEGLNAKNFREYFHDSIERREEMFHLFDLGYLSLEDRARGEDLFWETCRRALKYVEKMRHTPEEFEGLRRQLASRFVCNFSVFQSLPDAFALEQLFPVMPIHRLKEEPQVRGTLADITCDSDGVIDSFVDPIRSKNFLELHAPNGEPYCVGIFLTGAYQDVMGDLHNMFGMTNEVHVLVDGEGNFKFHRVVHGDTVQDVLDYLRFDTDGLSGNFYARVNEAVSDGLVSRRQAGKIFEEWTAGIQGYTYLDE